MTIDEQAQRLLISATKKAKAKLGAAWDSMPCLRDGAVAVEVLAIIAGKDNDEATAKTAQRIIAAASIFTAQSAD